MIFGYGVRADERGPTRMGETPGAEKTFGRPGDVRAGILPPKNKEFPTFGGGMRRSFEHMLDPQPSCTAPLARPPWRMRNTKGDVGHWGVTDG